MIRGKRFPEPGVIACLFLVSVLTSITTGCQKVPPAEYLPSPASADATSVVREMARKMSDARDLTFKVRRHLDPGLVGDLKVAESAEIDVAISRPNKIKTKVTTPNGVRYFHADGRKLSLFDETMKLYASVPMKGSIDEMIRRVDDKYGFAPPLAEFVVNDLYKAINEHAQSIAYLGKETINGLEGHHLALVGPVADADLWVSTRQHLPIKFVATFKDREGAPHLEFDFSDWNLTPALHPSLFIFVPPKDAAPIRMVNTDDPRSPRGGR